ncbi:DNA repair protein RadC [Delftia tsuruhatensis]|uniref:RadC family protein n=1 Tax=Delftia tsuruhatensis TaxID=180282 RepID=UPI001E729C3E|nr:DNA repair protein RadC [Delftia tsuruhatensis]CAB5671131.1 DNA repair protein RadC [Delftia tsuruhatensis]CAC9683153.1 DNA repair protein RadC [Delftia tsuruhatensis]
MLGSSVVRGCHTPVARSTVIPTDDDLIIQQAIAILEHRLFQRGPRLSGPKDVCAFLRLQLVAQEHEVFAAVFLDSQHQVLAYERLFQGSIDITTVYPRVILKRALEHGASAVVLCHNHPSGDTQPSAADRRLTEHVQTVLQLIEVRLLDHLIIGKGQPYSFAESGLI